LCVLYLLLCCYVVVVGVIGSYLSYIICFCAIVAVSIYIDDSLFISQY